jgi:hypothetical protein
MSRIIGISGRKQSGKNTCANYIVGDILKQRNMVQDFAINTDGQLQIYTTNANGQSGWGIFDLLRKDEEFLLYVENELWPYVKIYHFADPLKQMCMSLFNFTFEQAYGTDDQKNTNTDILWENIPENHDGKTGYITARDFMQHFGTNIVRKMKDNAWVDATLSRILYEDTEISIIPDVRFPNEVHAIKEQGGVVIRLNRDVHKSQHKCERALDEDNFDWSTFDEVIDNDTKNIEELSQSLNSISKLWR